jgi:hypothetical protein
MVLSTMGTDMERLYGRGIAASLVHPAVASLAAVRIARLSACDDTPGR